MARYLVAAGELTEGAKPRGMPGRSPRRTPPYWKSRLLRRHSLRDENQRGDHGSKDQCEAFPWGTRQRMSRTENAGCTAGRRSSRGPRLIARQSPTRARGLVGKSRSFHSRSVERQGDAYGVQILAARLTGVQFLLGKHL